MHFVKATRYLFLPILFLSIISPTSAQNTTEIAGLWKTQGYGWVFDISSSSVKVYQATTATCISVFETEDIEYSGNSVVVHDFQLPGIASLLVDASDLPLSLVEGKVLFDNSSAFPIYASRIEALPSSCKQVIKETKNAAVNFDVFWNMFAENFAFFNLYHVDWKQIYETYHSKVTDKTTDDELFDLFQQMVADITDAHLNIIASPTQVYSSGRYKEWTQNQDEAVIAAYVKIVTDKYLIDKPKLVANDKILYGHLSKTVGYINFLSMYEFGGDGTLSFSNNDDDIAALKKAMTTIVADLADVKTIVVDARFNPGGNDLNAVYVAGYFTDKSTVAFSKQTWDGKKFLELHDITIKPVDKPHFSQKVYFLTSNFTTSAGEVFTLTMSALPQVTTVGETTQGAFSDILLVFLPNGWLVTLSNERYVSHDGKMYEGLGIPPAIEVPMTEEALQKETDPVIEQALKLAVGQ